MENQKYNQNSQNLSQSDQTSRKKYYEGINNLKDYFRVLYERKISIIVIFLITVMVGTVVSITRPKTFEARGLGRIGQMWGKDIESVGKIKAVFDSEATLEEIASKLNLSPEMILGSIASKFDIKSDQGSGFLKIRGRGETPEEALSIANLISGLIIERHQKIIAQAQTVLEEDTKQIQDQIGSTEATIKVSREKIKDLEAEVQLMQRKTKDLIEEKGAVSEGRGLIIQAYMGTWQNSRDRLRNEETKLESLIAQEENLKANLREKKLQRTYNNRPTEIEVPAVLPQTKIAPDNRQNVKIAGFVGLFVGILYAFAAEYVSQHNEEFKKRS